MLKKLFLFLLMALPVIVLAACSDDDDDEEIKELKVDFDVPDQAETDETVELKATVTYGGEKVTDADDVVFEYWKKDHRDDSEKVDGENNGDGTYSAEVTFDEEDDYEMFAHTDAEGIHTMPKESITVE